MDPFSEFLGVQCTHGELDGVIWSDISRFSEEDTFKSFFILGHATQLYRFVQ